MLGWLALLQVALLWSCVPVLFDDRCGPEVRTTYVEPAPVYDSAGSIVARAYLDLTEDRGERSGRSIMLRLERRVVGGALGPLAGHVTAMLLLDDRNRLILDAAAMSLASGPAVAEQRDRAEPVPRRSSRCDSTCSPGVRGSVS